MSANLTPREREVLYLLCQGLPNKLIARRLAISLATVKIHVSNILSKVGVTSRLQAVVAAGSLGLVRDVDLSAIEGDLDVPDALVAQHDEAAPVRVVA